jgi:Putative peptidoglycan binding domain
LQSIAARMVRRVGLPVLLAGLAAAFPQAAGANPPTLKPGASGYWVRVVQQDLTDVGYALPLTGTFGTQTKNKVIAFKKAHALPADATVNPNAWTALSTAVKAEQRLPFKRAHLNSKGLAVAPAGAPIVVKRVIAAANKIAFTHYLYGGGHASWNSPGGYDCSGSVSYALHGGGLLWYPEDSSELESYGNGGTGKWMTIYANAGHAYILIAGLWFDTADQSWGSYAHGDRWSSKRVTSGSGYIVRHPTGF